MSTNAYVSATLDVFTSTSFTGNQLGLVVLSASQPVLTQAQKQAIALEYNYSESLFLHPPSDTNPTVRRLDIFVKRAEIPFAGHPVIGAAHYVFGLPSSQGINKITFICKAGPVVIEKDEVSGLARAEIPHNIRQHAFKVTSTALEAAHPELASANNRVDGDGPATDAAPVVSIVKGMTNIHVNLDRLYPNFALAALEGARPPPIVLDEDFAPSRHATTFYKEVPLGVPQAGGSKRRFQVRRFMSDGIEDSATGSAACGLGAWLSLKEGGRGARYRYEIEQGVDMGRASEIGVEVLLTQRGDGVEKVWLEGRAVLVSEGKMYV